MTLSSFDPIHLYYARTKSYLISDDFPVSNGFPVCNTNIYKYIRAFSSLDLAILLILRQSFQLS